MNPGKSRIKTAILLAAGRGSRLSPHTDTTPKALLPYAGKPTIEHIVDALHRAELKQLIIVTNYLEHIIIDYLQRLPIASEMKIKFVTQKELAGTADAVLTAIDAAPTWIENEFLLSATDYIVGDDFYADFVNFHYNHSDAISVSLKKVSADVQRMSSSVRLSNDMSIREVVEKPIPGTEPSPFSANLVYVLPQSITPYLRKTQPSSRNERELQSAVNEWLRNHGGARGLLQQTPREWQPELDL